uniref:Uncharacterized protein n=1 Tax=Astatotilapia calliptera TaxID=8154 RepID=A0A3P8QYC7_ASTCA
MHSLKDNYKYERGEVGQHFLWATIQRMPGVPGSSWPNSKFDITDMNAIVRLVKSQWHEGSERSLQAVYPECKGHHVRSICVYGAGDLQWLIEQHHLFLPISLMQTEIPLLSTAWRNI